MYEKARKKFSSLADVFENRFKNEKGIPKPQEKRPDGLTSMDALVPKSLFLFSRTNKLRILMVKIVTSKPFDIFVTTLIILNSLILGINDYNDDNPKTWRNDLNVYSEPVFTGLFTLELLMKVFAFGFIFGPNTYLKDKWNWIDLLVVITSLLSSLPQFGNYSAFRTFRLLRPLRSLNSLQNMKLLVSTLLSSLAQLGEIIVFALFFFLIFSIMGVSLWAGSIHYRCRETKYPSGGDWVAVADDTQLCGYRSCPSDSSGNPTYCGSLVVAHDKYHNVTVSNVYRDTQITELDFGLVTFDNVANAMLAIFQCITMEGWTKMMYYYSDAYFPLLTHFYFV